MEIFISHSSKDKWAARRISDDLTRLGATTFLDEKDITTGQSIDVEIRKNIRGCDDFLIILSPASIKSEWVLLELGGALALEKKVIPILFYVGANEIPQAISLKLARDINSIQSYYDEVKTNVAGKKAKPIKQKPALNDHSFKVGDKVLIVTRRPKDVMRNDSIIDWEPGMDLYLGQEAIIDYESRIFSNAYCLKDIKKSPESYYVFAKEWLTKIK